MSIHKYNRLTLIVAFIFAAFILNAQKNFTMYHLSQTTQANYLNPGFKQENRFYINLPIGMQNISFMNSGFKVSDALEYRTQDDSLELKPNLLLAQMKDLNYANFEMSNELFGLGFKIKENFISLSVRNRFQTRFTYPQDLFEFAFEGNGNDLLGKRASLDGFGLNLTSYFEYGLGFNRNINDKLTVGGRIKLLSGIANINTAKTELGITTDANSFAITIDGSSEINTSNISPFTDSTVSYSPISSLFNFANMGFGIDLGASYQYNDKLNFNASLLDLGVIKWKTNVNNYISNDVNYTFDGINLNQALDSIDIFTELSDTLRSVFKQNENNESYSTALRTKFYLGGSYKFNDFFNSSILVYNEIIGQKYNVGTSIAGNIQLKRWLSASVNYSIYGRSYNNVGFGLNLKGGPVQFYAMTDNILAMINPISAKHFHISFGMNIVVGPIKENKKIKQETREKERQERKAGNQPKVEKVETADPVQTKETN